MDLHFLGGATTVTGSRFLLTTARARVLVDCGMFQGGPNESIRNRIPLGFDPASLDAILLTHAHLDHCGLLPIVVREGFAGGIHCTTATAELADLVLLDSGRLHEEFAKRGARWEARNPDKAMAEDREQAETYVEAIETAVAEDGGRGEASLPDPSRIRFMVGSVSTHEHVATTIEPDGGWAAIPTHDPEAELRAQGPELLVDLDAPLYTEAQAARVRSHFRPIRYGEEREVASGVHVTFLDAGHILGSAILRLRVAAGADGEGSRERTIVFSGDLGRPNTPILRDPSVLTTADYVVVESTYGGREHQPTEQAIEALAEAVREVDRAGGVLLVPSFAIGRTQEIVYELDRLIERGEIPLLPLYLDSPMASKASDIYRRHPEFYDDDTRAILEAGGSPLDYPKQIVTNDVRHSQAITAAPRPYMVVASNGMLTGGRVVAHLRNLIDDPSATILFVGYQGRGTLGSHLQAGAETVKLDGEVRRVRCRIRSIDGFSAHADESELLDWLRAFVDGRRRGDPGVPRRVFLVHGDPEAQIALAPKVAALGLEPYVPRWHESVELD